MNALIIAASNKRGGGDNILRIVVVDVSTLAIQYHIICSSRISFYFLFGREELKDAQNKKREPV